VGFFRGFFFWKKKGRADRGPVRVASVLSLLFPPSPFPSFPLQTPFFSLLPSFSSSAPRPGRGEKGRGGGGFLLFFFPGGENAPFRSSLSRRRCPDPQRKRRGGKKGKKKGGKKRQSPIRPAFPFLSLLKSSPAPRSAAVTKEKKGKRKEKGGGRKGGETGTQALLSPSSPFPIPIISYSLVCPRFAVRGEQGGEGRGGGGKRGKGRG